MLDLGGELCEPFSDAVAVRTSQDADFGDLFFDQGQFDVLEVDFENVCSLPHMRRCCCP